MGNNHFYYFSTMKEYCQPGCICKKACNLIGCIREHPLVTEENIHLFFLRGDRASIKECRVAFETIQPPKVSDEQIRLRRGVVEKPKKLNPYQNGRIRKKIDGTKQEPFLKWGRRKYNYAGILVKKTEQNEYGDFVYYNEHEEKYLFENGIKYNKEAISQFIEFKELPKHKVFPKTKKVMSEPNPAAELPMRDFDFKTWYDKQDTPNFHEGQAWH